MSIEDDIKKKKAELAQLEKLKREAEEKQRELEEQLRKQEAKAWTPSRDSIKAILNEERVYIGWGDREYTGSVKEALIEEASKIVINDTYSLVHEDRHGGCEGAGEEHWIVFSARKGDEIVSYWMVPGWYASYDGAHLEWDELHEVAPKEVLVRKWV